MTKTTVIATDKEHLEKLIKEAIQAEGFKCNLNHIDVSQVTDMKSLFEHSKFNGDISAWNTSKVTDMTNLFQNSRFQGDISEWNVANVENMESMFHKSIFNGDISAWNTSRVHNMMRMFGNSKFNGNLSKWNIANVKDMWGMFQRSDFNRDIGAWDVSNVLDMDCMFIESRFNGDLSHWSFKNDVMITNFFDSDKLDQFEIPNMYHWHLLLNGFVTQNAQWQEHVDACVPIIRSLSFTEKEAAMFMHKAWLGQQPTCETALTVPFESLEMT